jgi:hypothetical protein
MELNAVIIYLLIMAFISHKVRIPWTYTLVLSSVLPASILELIMTTSLQESLLGLLLRSFAQLILNDFSF